MRFGRKESGKTKKRPTRGVVPVRPVSRPDTQPEEASASREAPEEKTGSDSPSGPTRMERFRSTRLFRFLASRRLHFTLAGALFAVLVAWGSWEAYHYLHHSPNFGLKHVEISPTFHVDRETLLSMAGLEYGKNIFSISPAQVRRRILAHPWVRRVQVTRKLPDTVQIDVTEHDAAAVVAFSEKSDCAGRPDCPPPATAFYLVNTDAELFKRATPQEMQQKVIISGIAREDIGKNPQGVARLLRRSLDLAELWAENPARPPLGEIQVADDIFILVLRHVPCEIHLEPSDARRRMEMLDSLWDRLDPPLEKTRIIYLDDRENPGRVVVIPESTGDATPTNPVEPPVPPMPPGP